MASKEKYEKKKKRKQLGPLSISEVKEVQNKA